MVTPIKNTTLSQFQTKVATTQSKYQSKITAYRNTRLRLVGINVSINKAKTPGEKIELDKTLTRTVLSMRQLRNESVKALKQVLHSQEELELFRMKEMI